MKPNKIVLFLSLCFSYLQADNPIVVWDLHDTLLQPKSRIVTVMKYPHFKKVFSQASLGFLKDLVKLIGKNIFGSTSSEEFMHIANKHNNPHFGEIVIRYANAQEVIPGMQEIVDELAQRDIEQHIGSNIGKTAFRRLIDSSENPHLAPLFKPMNIPKSHVVSLKNGKIAPKPNKLFFEEYLGKNNIDLKKKQVIFIDDRIENIRAAKAFGFDAILFKNPRQLRIELSKRNMPIKIPQTKYSSQRDKHALRSNSSFYKPLFSYRPYLGN